MQSIQHKLNARMRQSTMRVKLLHWKTNHKKTTADLLKIGSCEYRANAEMRFALYGVHALLIERYQYRQWAFIELEACNNALMEQSFYLLGRFALGLIGSRTAQTVCEWNLRAIPRMNSALVLSELIKFPVSGTRDKHWPFSVYFVLRGISHGMQ